VRYGEGCPLSMEKGTEEKAVPLSRKFWDFWCENVRYSK